MGRGKNEFPRPFILENKGETVLNILVVDDEIEIADVVELYLQSDQYHIYKFYTGQEHGLYSQYKD